ncbi:MAG: GAF domain-containing sensor histidine kinase [Gemmatimonadetes bacterium]|nr:GAF domain-containing sensor histidine kinase [Gemmatimonadota bacterium]
MMEANPPSNEEARLAALKSYEILDTDPEEAFDDLTTVAARVCGTPIALVSLIDADRQWFKSRVGLGATETPRKYAFCSHAILQPGKPLVVEDAKLDPRFHDNPLVTGDPNVIFYAGAPLVSPDGMPLGTLCVIDNEPRAIDEESLETLMSLARATVRQFELRKTCIDLRVVSQNLAAANENLEKRNDEIRRFYQTLSHELKTPLTVVRECMSLAFDGLLGTVNPDQRELLGTGVENCDRLARSVNDLLDLARLESCKFKLVRKPVPAAGLHRSAVAGLDTIVERAGLKFVTEADESLPALMADKDRVVQVIHNLIRNAIKFTPPGGTITVGARRGPDDHDSVEFSVSDTGRGIPANDQERIFDRLYQCEEDDCATRQGLGLGLHVSREIVRLHGGELSVESVEGEGSTFRFTLRAVDVAAHDHSRNELSKGAV